MGWEGEAVLLKCSNSNPKCQQGGLWAVVHGSCFPVLSSGEQLPNIPLVDESSLVLQQVEMVESKLKNSPLIPCPSPAARPEPRVLVVQHHLQQYQPVQEEKMHLWEEARQEPC